MNPNLRRRPDYMLFIPVVILLGFGLVMVYSASTIRSRDLYGDGSLIFFKQLIALILGLVAMAFAALVPHQFYRRPLVLVPAVIGVVVLLAGVIFQIEAKGAHRWYYFGRFGFQPSDLAKLVLIMVVAASGTAFRNHPKAWKRRLTIILPVLALFCGLILAQPDFGTTMILLAVAGTMLFLAGMPLRYLILAGILVLPVMTGLLVTEPYRWKRITDFVFSEQEHYQTRQSKMAIGSGGLTGLGLGQGRHKLHYLPEPHTDFIFATLCEEFGFLGALTVVASYLFLLLRGGVVLRKVPSLFSRILGGGLLALLGMQALINISIALDLFPNKGLTLPFMSAGGTSLIMCLWMFGILLNISQWRDVENRVAL